LLPGACCDADGNRLRRIFSDGRADPTDPDPTFMVTRSDIGRAARGWSIRFGILPQAYLAVSESVGVPNNGDVHVVERIHLGEPDLLHDDLEITAPHVLQNPWKTSRKFFRQRARKFEIVEGVCLQGYFAERVDKLGNAVFVPIPQTGAATGRSFPRVGAEPGRGPSDRPRCRRAGAGLAAISCRPGGRCRT
jgi:hypothetical protein